MTKGWWMETSDSLRLRLKCLFPNYPEREEWVEQWLARRIEPMKENPMNKLLCTADGYEIWADFKSFIIKKKGVSNSYFNSLHHVALWLLDNRVRTAADIETLHDILYEIRRVADGGLQ